MTQIETNCGRASFWHAACITNVFLDGGGRHTFSDAFQNGGLVNNFWEQQLISLSLFPVLFSLTVHTVFAGVFFKLTSPRQDGMSRKRKREKRRETETKMRKFT